MKPRMLAVGLVGSFVAAICCFTPALVVALGAVGLSAWVGWLDAILLPLFVLFLLLTAYAYFAKRRPK